MTGCEMPNIYTISDIADENNENNKDNKRKYLFTAEEKSGCFSRNCMKPHIRELDIEVNHAENNDPFLLLHKDCNCAFLCFCRPEMEVSLVEGGINSLLGTIRFPMVCKNVTFEVYDGFE